MRYRHSAKAALLLVIWLHLALSVAGAGLSHVTPLFFATTDTYTASDTWTCPAGVTTVAAEVWAAGENGVGGGGSHSGGGGAYSKKNSISVTPTTGYTVTVGTAGAPGGDSWFVNSTTVLAKGGGSVATHVGGAASGGIGDTKFSGGDGAAGGSNGGGGGAGDASNGGNQAAGVGGSGGTAGGGNGGNGSGGSGTIGNTIGGGGGNGFASGNTGARGEVRITYTAVTSNTYRGFFQIAITKNINPYDRPGAIDLHRLKNDRRSK